MSRPYVPSSFDLFNILVCAVGNFSLSVFSYSLLLDPPLNLTSFYYPFAESLSISFQTLYTQGLRIFLFSTYPFVFPLNCKCHWIALCRSRPTSL